MTAGFARKRSPPILERMDPIAFYIGPKPVYWYGIFVALGFLAGVLHWSWLAKREKRAPGIASDLSIWIMIGALLGARIAYVLANWPQYADAPWLMLRIDQGGLVFYGGFLGASVSVILFARTRHEPLWRLADFVVSALPLGHAFGRVGCFINGCCYGIVSDSAFGVYTAGAYRQPVQIYEAVGNLALYFLLLRFHLRRKIDGSTLAFYLAAYGTMRFLLEFLRGDVRIHALGLTAAQWTSLLFLLASAMLFARGIPRIKASKHKL